MPNKYLEQYRAMKLKDRVLQKCPVCDVLSSKNLMEPHHPRGRYGDRILQYIWVHPTCHQYIHNHPHWAKEEGLLFPQIYRDE